MFCEKCGSKNKENAKFCEKCGHEITKEKSKNKFLEKVKNLPKKTKIIMATVLLIAIIAIIVLGILLNNPIKKVEDSLDTYYTNYSSDNKKELIEIGKILKNNKENNKVLKSIEDRTHKTVEKWLKNFNIEYKDNDVLKENYEKVYGAIKDIYEYYDGLEYMLSEDDYESYYEELYELYSSKYYYLSAKEYEKEDDYSTFNYYKKVIEKDIYYKKAQQFINDYTKDEIENFKKEAEAIIKTDDKSSDEDILNSYLDQITYMNGEVATSDIGLGDTEEYKKLYENATDKIISCVKNLSEENAKNGKYDEAVYGINQILKYFPSDSDAYKELNDLLNTYKNKIPDKLTMKSYENSTYGVRSINYRKEINDKEYNSSISFNFRGETETIVYNIDGEYKKFKASIVRENDWSKNLNGYFIISGDGKELYKSSNITKTSEINADIDLDVTDVKSLKIEFVTTSKTNVFDSFYIYLVEPYLYKE